MMLIVAAWFARNRDEASKAPIFHGGFVAPAAHGAAG